MKIDKKQKVKLRSGEIGFFITDDPKDKLGRRYVYFDDLMDDYVLAYEHNLTFINENKKSW
jgi:hypothetical protein